MGRGGRKSAYESRIKSRFDEISEWCASGATDKIIAFNLGISESTFFKYKAEKSEFADFLKKSRQSFVLKLRGKLAEKAMGFEYTESKTITKTEADGSVTTTKEVYTKRALPDVAALNLLLKNYDSENWANDPQLLALKKEELELKKQQIEKEAW